MITINVIIISRVPATFVEKIKYLPKPTLKVKESTDTDSCQEEKIGAGRKWSKNRSTKENGATYIGFAVICSYAK